MKALSVRAPWWWAILHGKPVENRDWYTRFRGTIVLHASKYWNRTEIDYALEDIAYAADFDRLTMPKADLDSMRESCGCLVGTVDVVDCVSEHPSAFFTGKFGFVLENAVAFALPIPCKGALGFFDVPDDLLPRPPGQK